VRVEPPGFASRCWYHDVVSRVHLVSSTVGRGTLAGPRRCVSVRGYRVSTYGVAHAWAHGDDVRRRPEGDEGEWPIMCMHAARRSRGRTLDGAPINETAREPRSERSLRPSEQRAGVLTPAAPSGRARGPRRAGPS
jgi:hypothetical protein